MAELSELTITQLWQQIRLLSNESIAGMAAQWKTIAEAHFAAAQDLQTRTDTLLTTWDGGAATAFAKHSGDTINSLMESYYVAIDNSIRLNNVAEALGTAQQKLEPLWQQYSRDMEKVYDHVMDAGTVKHLWWFVSDSTPTQDKVNSKYNALARAIVTPLDDMAVEATSQTFALPDFAGPKGLRPDQLPAFQPGGLPRPG
ncbi:MAG: WXG100 family type VII secretion target, partial [Frankia sp.]